jgi:hypothetical protein
MYDHLLINVHQQPKLIMRNNSNQLYLPNSKSECDNLNLITKRKSLPFDEQEQPKRRYTVTNISIPQTIICSSVRNQAYDKTMIRKSSTTHNLSTCQQTNRIPISTSNIELKSMDFRPLIINGRRKLSSIPSSSSMIIIKKKCPYSMTSISFEQVGLSSYK